MRLTQSLCISSWIAISVLAVSVSAKPCRVLALSGGGDKGAYEVGVIKSLVENLPDGEAAWDVVTGISAGSINAAAISAFAVGDEARMTEYLVGVARNLTRNDIFRNWILGPLEGILLKPSIFDSAPEHNWVHDMMKPLGTIKRKLVIGATSYNTGSLDTWNETHTTEEVATGVLASSAIPGVFQPVAARGEYYCDGGVKTGVNIMAGVARCLEQTTSDNIVVDVVLCDGGEQKKIDPTKHHTIGFLMRAASIMRYQSSREQIKKAKASYPKTNFRFGIWPSVKLPGLTSLDFKPKDIEKMIEIGMMDAKNAIGNLTTTV